MERTTTQLTEEDISKVVPKGISGFYKQQFERLRSQLKTHCSSEIDMKGLLEVLVAAEGPLPLCLLPECLGLADDTEFEVREVISEVMSSILSVYDDCLTLYHKSLRDWFLSDGYREHAFTVGSKNGHVRLWKACKNVFDKIISSSTLCDFINSPCQLTGYALAHGISHMIEAGSEADHHLAVDVKIVHVRIMRQPVHLEEIENECLQIFNNLLLNLSPELLRELKWHITYFQDFGPYVDSAFYLQSVANSVHYNSEKRTLARSLLKEGKYFWLEDLNATVLTNNFYKTVFLRTDVTCLGVSPDEQLVAVGYNDGRISIFTAPDFTEVHAFDTIPKTNVDICNYEYCPVYSCSFSPSGSRLVTSDGSRDVKVWDINGEKLLACMDAGGPVDSCWFSECGMFIVASKEMELIRNESDRPYGHGFTIWNVLTKQRVDRRIIPSRWQAIGQYNFQHTACTFPPDDNIRDQLLLYNDGDFVEVFQLPNALPVARLLKTNGSSSTWYNTDNSTMSSRKVDFDFNPPLSNDGYYFGRRCGIFKSTRVAPIKFQTLFAVPYFDRLSIFSASNNRNSIQPSLISMPYVIDCCCFSPDGSFLATFVRNLPLRPLSILIWDTKLCTVVDSIHLEDSYYAEGCWWSGNYLWICDQNYLVRITIFNGRFDELSREKQVKIDREHKQFLTFSDVLIFIDKDNSVNIARIEHGEIQYMESFSDNSILSAAVSPCNSVIFTANLKTFQVWKEDQTKEHLHWVALNAVEIKDHFPSLPREGVKCCITSDGTRGVLVLDPLHTIVVELESLNVTVYDGFGTYRNFNSCFAGNSYCIVPGLYCSELNVLQITNGHIVAGWDELSFDRFDVFALSQNNLLAAISSCPARIRFFKIVAPE